MAVMVEFNRWRAEPSDEKILIGMNCACLLEPGRTDNYQTVNTDACCGLLLLRFFSVCNRKIKKKKNIIIDHYLD